MKTRTILLIEDNPDDVRLTQRAFKDNGITNELDVVYDGASALEYLKRTVAELEHELPTVTLLDLNLPKINGLEVLKFIRSHPSLKLMPVVILTSSKEEVDIIRGYGLGANSYIQKPVEFDEFAAAVRQLGLYWLLLNEHPPRPV